MTTIEPESESAAKTSAPTETIVPSANENNPRRWHLPAVAFLLLIAGGLALGFVPRHRQEQITAADTGELMIPTVSIVSPKPEGAQNGLLLPAEIRPWLEASIYARANGYLKNWLVDIGANVEAGQLLGVIETPDLDQQLAQARAELDLAQASFQLAKTTDDRWQTLVKTSSVSEQEAAEKSAARATAAANVEASRANVRRLEELVSFQRVVAPFAGSITARSVDIGDLIVSGTGGNQLFHVAQTDKLRVYVRVPESEANGIAPGREAILTIPGKADVEFPARVVTTAAAISTASRTLLTELEVDNSKHEILPYSFGEVRFTEAQKNTQPTLPSTALLFRADGLQVSVVRPDNTIELRKVRVGRDFGQTIEVLSGVTASDRVVANPSDSLVAGVAVRIAEASTTTTK